MPQVSLARPIVAEIDSRLAPVDLFELISSKRLPFFLDSGMGAERLGRYSFLGCEPFLVLSAHARDAVVRDRAGAVVRAGATFDVLRGLLRDFRVPEQESAVPFTGGAVGYFSYDLCHLIERLPRTVVSDLGFPDVHLGFYFDLLAYDHLSTHWYAVCCPLPGESERALKRRTDGLKRLVDGATLSREEAGTGPRECKARCNFTREQYLRAVERAREYIFAGDIFQVNLSQRFELQTQMSAPQIYRTLRSINPAPFAFYYDLGSRAVIGASPERFIQVQGDRVWTRPIKGTRRRIGNARADERAKAELLASEKDRAELTMIVDLERNDLGRVCRYGSVRVTEPIVLEEYPSVYHLVATVEGDLHPRHDLVDLLKATFPGGSITGAPKIRAMEIIDELEPTQRSVYTGSCGYIGFDGRVDLNVAIRTILMEGRRACFQVGGGIVADSGPEAEYQETLDKGQRLFAALGAEPPYR